MTLLPKRVVLYGIAVSLILGLVACQEKPKEPKEPKEAQKLQGTITLTLGKVFVNDKTAKTGDKVKSPDRIRTGKKSMVTIQLGSKANITIRSSSELALRSLEQGGEHASKVRLIQQKGSTYHKIVTKPVDYKVQTYSVVAGVRGTSFQLSVDSKDKANVKLLKGKLELSHPSSPKLDTKADGKTRGDTVTLEAGYGVDVEGNKIAEPKPLKQDEKQELQVYEEIAMLEPEELDSSEKVKKHVEQVVPQNLKKQLKQLEQKETERQGKLRQEQKKASSDKKQKTKQKRKLTLKDLKEKYGKLSVVETKVGKKYIGAFQQMGNNVRVVTVNGKVTFPSSKIAKVSPYKD